MSAGDASRTVTATATAAGATGVARGASRTVTVAFAAAGVVRASFLAYDLDSNSSQAFNIGVSMSGFLEPQVTPVAPPAGQTTVLLRVSPVMPTPTLDSNGRPT